MSEERRRIAAFCPLCVSRCGCEAVVEDGRLVAIEPDPSHPTGKALCAKGRASPELVEASDRLLYPMRRTRPKGDPDPGWRRITWDEALDETATAMRRIAEESGPEAVAFAITTTAGTAISDAGPWIDRLINAFGSPNNCNATEICAWHRNYARVFTTGTAIGTPDYEQAGCMLLWGHNPSTSLLAAATKVADARARGAKLIVIDPRRIGFAVKADCWLRVRPGTDAAIALAIAGIMIDQGWFDIGFVRDWTNGPFLVRDDDGTLLRSEMLAAAAKSGGFVAWDEIRGAPIAYAIGNRQAPRAHGPSWRTGRAGPSHSAPRSKWFGHRYSRAFRALHDRRTRWRSCRIGGARRQVVACQVLGLDADHVLAAEGGGHRLGEAPWRGEPVAAEQGHDHPAARQLLAQALLPALPGADVVLVVEQRPARPLAPDALADRCGDLAVPRRYD